jgi:hypothetical protein
MLEYERCSTELIRDNFISDMITRPSALELYGIDYPCRRLMSQGVFPKEMDRTLKSLNDIMPQLDGHYRDLRHACNSILGVEHGTNAFGVQLIILAPIFVRILNSVSQNDCLKIDLECFPEWLLDNMSIVVYDRMNPNTRIILKEFVKYENCNIYSQIVQLPGPRLSLSLYKGSDLLEERPFSISDVI